MNPRRPRSQFVALVVIGLVVAVGETLSLLFLTGSGGVDAVGVLILAAALAMVIVGVIGLRRRSADQDRKR
jgi:amino acid transporter